MTKAGIVRLSCVALSIALVGTACSGKKKSAVIKLVPSPSVVLAPGAPPQPCPLTDAPAPGGIVPNRPAYAVKIPNDSSARPQAGLNNADIVYEELVEGGITRFLAIFQCQDAQRIEPIRSARFVDLDILGQFSKPIFGNAGAIGPVLDAIAAAAKAGQIINAEYSGTPYANDYQRDSSRSEPQNEYTSTQAIYATAGPSAGLPPQPVFTFIPPTATAIPSAPASVPPSGAATSTPNPNAVAPTLVSPTDTPGPGSTVAVPFSSPDFTATWTWEPSTSTYLRAEGGVPEKLSDGSQIAAANVVIMSVGVTPSQYTEDKNGSKENLIATTGQGKAIICRLGGCVRGTWARPSTAETIQYTDAAGSQIPLTPGNVWVELEPNTQAAQIS